MDIVAARKKAAERAKAQKAGQEQAPVQPVIPEEPAAQVVPQAQPLRAEAAPASPTAATPAGAGHPQVAEQPSPAVAEESPEQPRQETELEMLAFLLGSEEYVVMVDQVKEVLTPKEITPVPHSADYLVGVCSLRGTVMPVIDLNRRLGLAGSVRDEKSRIVVVSVRQEDQVGLFVDRVRGVVRILPSAVKPAPETVEQGAGAEFLKGIARKDDQLYILLDVEKAIGS